MSISFKAAVLENINSTLKIKDLKFPKLKIGQVLVKVLFSGVCRSQLMEIEGKRGEDKWLPHCLGHEGSGIVVDIGNKVTKVKKNDEVILTWIKGKGINAANAVYNHKSSIVNSGQVTTFSQYSIVSENRLVKKPKFIDHDEAVLYGCAIPTGFGMVINEIKPKKNMSVIVIGIGGIGMSALLALKCLKIKKIIVIDVSNKKIQMAKKFGFKNSFNGNDKNLDKKISKILKDGADVCIECAGTIKTIEKGFSLIKDDGGKLLFASHPPNNEKASFFPHDFIKGKQISGSWGGKTYPDRDIAKIAKMIKDSNISLKPLVSKKYQLKDINNAIKDLKNGKVFRPIIDMRS
tara:strand:- start:283 stop:1326 length:1044 start_codon:yes stop_codon:yes gene_type:complete